MSDQHPKLQAVKHAAPGNGAAKSRIFRVSVEGANYQVEVEEIGATRFITSVKPSVPGNGAGATHATDVPREKPSPPLELVAKPHASEPAKATQLIAPMPGIIVRHEKSVGEGVNAGDVVVVLEAMKMQNSIITPAGGKVTAIHCEPGQMVKKGAVLAVIA